MDENNNVVVRVGDQEFIRGEDGYSPVVTIEEIEHGHSVNITDREHQAEGQTFNVLDGASAYEQAVAGGYEGTEEEFAEDLAGFSEKAEDTEENMLAAAEYARLAGISESNAANSAGTASESAAAANYSMNDANTSAQSAERFASDASRDAGTASTAAATATAKAGEASNSATAADGSAKDAEAYAVGKRGGTDVGSTDPAYHNNAKYYAEQAAGSTSDAVTAKGAAETAQTAAETAQGKAEDAQEAAETAQGAAETAAQSVSQSAAQISQNASDISDLKSAFVSFDNKVFLPDGVAESTTMETKPEPGYYSPSNGGWNASEQYTTKYIDFESESDFYIEVVTLNQNYIYCSEYSSHTPSRDTFIRGFSYGNNNLPSIDSKLHVEPGHTVTVSFYFTNVIKEHYTIPVENNELSNTVILNSSQLEQAKVFWNEMTVDAVQNSYGLDYYGKGYFRASNGIWYPSDQYRAFVHTFNEDSEFYVSIDKLNQPYIFLVVYSSETKSSATRLTSYTYSENNLPDSLNRITVLKGQSIALSTYFTNTVSAHYLSKYGGLNLVKGRKMVWFGDSISQYSSMPDRVADYTGLDIKNCSFAGTPMTYANPTTQQALGFLGLSSAIASGDFTAQEAALTAQAQTTPDETYWELVERQRHLSVLESLDFSTVTDVVVMLGTNDLGNSYVTTTSSLDNFKAGMRTAIQNVLTAYPKIRLKFISNPYRGDITPSNPDQYGHSLVDIIAAEKEVCSEFNLPYFDLYSVCGINSLNEATYLQGDKLHLKNDAGYILISKIISAWTTANY